MFSANLRINRPVGFLPYFFKPTFQFVTAVSGAAAAPYSCVAELSPAALS